MIGWRTASGIPVADCADAVSVPVDEDQTIGINFILKNQVFIPPVYQAASIYGTVTDHNGQLAGVKMSLLFNNMSSNQSNIYSLSMQTESDGTYSFFIPPGSYLINIPSNWEDTPYAYQRKEVQVTEEEQSIQVDFQLELAPSIRGSIYQADGEHLVDDTYLVRFQESCTTVGDGPEATAVSGLYSSPVLPAGGYFLALLSEDGEFIGWRTASGVPSTNCADAVSVPVDEDQTTGINFILKNRIILTPVYYMLLSD
ncbi:MAG: carboxypeptidase regulatory-like domain-containing protein [Candidatus Electrothrix sp. ATG2]|nr:carboxypeptidase regulatory-like domain-containing protein [Candidatus Electrothrix sp. ATG2]